MLIGGGSRVAWELQMPRVSFEAAREGFGKRLLHVRTEKDTRERCGLVELIRIKSQRIATDLIEDQSEDR